MNTPAGRKSIYRHIYLARKLEKKLLALPQEKVAKLLNRAESMERGRGAPQKKAKRQLAEETLGGRRDAKALARAARKIGSDRHSLQEFLRRAPKPR